MTFYSINNTKSDMQNDTNEKRKGRRTRIVHYYYV